ncbi:MAG: indolepyruvate oxidoreductase subunit beta [Thermoplasmatales archaeon]
MVSIVLCGVGGQGIITVANIIGRATVKEGKNVLMTELHGMAQRGGKILVELRIGDYKSAIIPAGRGDVLLGFEELEAARNAYKIKEDGFLIVNRRRIHTIPLIAGIKNYPEESVETLERRGAYFIEADSLALELGNKRVVNTIMSGVLFSTGILGLSEDSIKSSIKESVNSKYWDVNLRAFEAGKGLISSGQQTAIYPR